MAIPSFAGASLRSVAILVCAGHVAPLTAASLIETLAAINGTSTPRLKWDISVPATRCAHGVEGRAPAGRPARPRSIDLTPWLEPAVTIHWLSPIRSGRERLVSRDDLRVSLRSSLGPAIGTSHRLPESPLRVKYLLRSCEVKGRTTIFTDERHIRQLTHHLLPLRIICRRSFPDLHSDEKEAHLTTWRFHAPRSTPFLRFTHQSFT